MLDLMSDEEVHYCQVTVQNLRIELYNIQNDLRVLKAGLDNQLDPPNQMKVYAIIAVRDKLEARRRFNGMLIAGIREVLVNPPSLESRIIACINRVLSFRFI